MGTHLYLNEEALRPMDAGGKALGTLWIGNVRTFRIPMGDYTYELALVKEETDMPFAEPLPTGTPSYADCAEVIAVLFKLLLSAPPKRRGRLESVVPFPGDFEESAKDQGPNYKAGWTDYRRHLAETCGIKVPEWENLPYEVQESYISGILTAIEGEASGGETVENAVEPISLVDWARRSAEIVSGWGPGYHRFERELWRFASAGGGQ